ncbi:hypothetical protein GR160_17435 [Flavobacterium sp. Sd200]|uniref:hypothetical protein n=1 Tax=Flavobacterium sp. Sd200 TaxID=2692211 RepID=UPI00136E9FF3|nr:hypothetical protein [Flavobacterium sp. Sd200]MXN93012.1 hypothetical protein [Flavobacterium sp. Sd200]
MLPGLPFYIPSVFNITVAATAVYSVKTVQRTGLVSVKKLSWAMGFWLVLQAVLTLLDFYDSPVESTPPKLALFGILPATIALLTIFTTQNGRNFIDSLPQEKLILLHTLRIPIELVLYWLSLNMAVPELITFTGSNFDIIAGLTAPLVYYAYVRKNISRNVLLLWNVVCLCLLINIVVLAILSAPSPMQQFALDQPNVAMLNFPFSWLPTFIVPLVLFSHLASIRKLIVKPVDTI